MTNHPLRLIRRRAPTVAPRLVLAALALCTLGATAQPQAVNGPPGQHHGPPAEALAACTTSKAGDACSFTGPRGAAKGRCWAPPGLALACRPKDAPAPGDKMPVRSNH